MRTALSRLLAVVLVVGLVTAACASEPTDEERAAAREALAQSLGGSDGGTDPPPTDPTPTDAAPATSAPLDRPPPARGADFQPPTLTVEEALSNAPESVSTAISAAHAALDAVEEACGDPDAWSAAMSEAVAAVGDATRAAEATNIGAWRGESGGDDTARHIRDRMIRQTGCTAGEPGEGSLEMLVRAGEAASANDALIAQIGSQEDPALASEFWYHANHLGHWLEVQRLVAADDPPDILVAGSSTSQWGFDPVVISDRTGRSTMNISLPAATTPALAPWIDQVRTRTGASTVVVGISVYEDFRACAPTEATTERVAATFAAQREAFAPLAGLADVEPADRLTGGGTGYPSNAVLAAHVQGFEGTRGAVTGSDTAPEGLVEQQRQTHRSRFATVEQCTALRQNTISTLGTLRDDGVQVILVALPLADEYVEFHPEGRAGFDLITAEYAESADGLDITFLDLTDAVPAENFRDLTHVDKTGRDTVTNAVIEALER